MKKFITLILLAVLMASCMSEEKARKRFPCPSLTFFKIQRDTCLLYTSDAADE